MPQHKTKTQLEALTVVRLRALAKTHNVKVSGRKAELVTRILAAQTDSGMTRIRSISHLENSKQKPTLLPQDKKRSSNGSSKTPCAMPPDNSCTVAQLRSLLTKRKLKTSGKKAVLIERLRSPKPQDKKRSFIGSSKTPCVMPPDNSCTVTQLRSLLTERKLGKSGKKAVLIERLTATHKQPNDDKQKDKVKEKKRPALKGSRDQARKEGDGRRYAQVRFNATEEMKRTMAKIEDDQKACSSYTDTRRAKRVTDRDSLAELASTGPHYTTHLCSKNAPILYAEPNSKEACCRPRAFPSDPKPKDTIDEPDTIRLSKKANMMFSKALKGSKARAHVTGEVRAKTPNRKSKR